MTSAPLVCNVVIYQDRKFLLVQEKLPEAYGLWNLPGGHVDESETLEQAAIREALEETGLTVEIVRQLLVFHMEVARPVLHAYEVKIVSGELHIPKDELLASGWFSYEEIVAMKSKLRSSEYIIGATELIAKA